MSWVAVDKDGAEWVYRTMPFRRADKWDQSSALTAQLEIQKGSIERLIGRTLTWADEPVEL